MIRRCVVEGAIGDTVEEREVSGGVFLGGRFSRLKYKSSCTYIRNSRQDIKTHISSKRKGAESNDACRATLTDGLARTKPASPAATTAYSRHEATSAVIDTISKFK